jgi:hypothetical protein
MTAPTAPLPVVSLLNEVMIIQGYLWAVTQTSLPAVISQNPQYATLVTHFSDWQQDLWSEFWEGLLSGSITAQSEEIADLFDDQITDQSIMHNVLYDAVVPGVVALCDDVAEMLTHGQSLLLQLEAIAQTIEGADLEAVAQLTALTAILEAQFDQQEDSLTQSAIDSGVEVVSTAVDLTIAVGSEGEDIEPLVKGVIKLGQDAITQLVLTAEIKQTLGQLETAWAALDKATGDLARITLICNQLKAVTDDASNTFAALQELTNDWSTVATVTTLSADEWANGGRAALQEWAARIVRLSFGYATQQIKAATAGARSLS